MAKGAISLKQAVAAVMAHQPQRSPRLGDGFCSACQSTRHAMARKKVPAKTKAQRQTELLAQAFPIKIIALHFPSG